MIDLRNADNGWFPVYAIQALIAEDFFRAAQADGMKNTDPKQFAVLLRDVETTLGLLGLSALAVFRHDAAESIVGYRRPKPAKASPARGKRKAK